MRALSQVGSDWLWPRKSQTVFGSKSMFGNVSSLQNTDDLEHFASFFAAPNE